MTNKLEVHEQYYRADDVADKLKWEGELAIRNKNVAALSGALLMNCAYAVVDYMVGGGQSLVPVVSFPVLVVALITATAARNRHESKLFKLTPVVIEDKAVAEKTINTGG